MLFDGDRLLSGEALSPSIDISKDSFSIEVLVTLTDIESMKSNTSATIFFNTVSDDTRIDLSISTDGKAKFFSVSEKSSYENETEFENNKMYRLHGSILENGKTHLLANERLDVAKILNKLQVIAFFDVHVAIERHHLLSCGSLFLKQLSLFRREGQHLVHTTALWTIGCQRRIFVNAMHELRKSDVGFLFESQVGSNADERLVERQIDFPGVIPTSSLIWQKMI
jgi:hypothetical protein